MSFLSRERQENLRQNYNKVVENIKDPDVLAEKLFSKQIFSIRQLNKIKHSTKDPKDKARELLDYVLHFDAEQYDAFVLILADTQQMALADMLRDEELNSQTQEKRSTVLKPDAFKPNLHSLPYKKIQFPDVDLVRDQEHLLGSGGFASVYVGQYKTLGIKAAFKVLKGVGLGGLGPGIETSFLKEAESMYKLKSSHVVEIFGILQEPNDGVYAIVMEYMELGSIYDVITKLPNLEWSIRYYMINQAVSGLVWLHRQQPEIGGATSYVGAHGDLKAQNLLVKSNFTVKLGDFGLARLRQISSKSTKVKNEGTTTHIPPEIWDCECGLNQKSDVWSFGVTLFEIAGGTPFSHLPDVPNEAMYGRYVTDKKGKPVDFKSVSCDPTMEDLITRCLCYAPEDRPTFIDMQMTLRDIWQGEGYERVFYQTFSKACQEMATIQEYGQTVEVPEQEVTSQLEKLKLTGSPLGGSSNQTEGGAEEGYMAASFTSVPPGSIPDMTGAPLNSGPGSHVPDAAHYHQESSHGVSAGVTTPQKSRSPEGKVSGGHTKEIAELRKDVEEMRKNQAINISFKNVIGGQGAALHQESEQADEEWHNKSVKHKNMRENWAKIQRDLEVDGLITHLFANYLISDIQKEKLERTDLIRHDQAGMILDIMKRKDEAAMDKFIEGIREQNQEHIANMLDA